MFGTKEKIKKINGAIIAPLGFEAAGIRTGVKRRRKDLALIYTKNAAISAGVYTTNVVKAAPLLVTKDIVEKGTPINAIIINSGNANACTGAKGLTNAWEIIEKTQKVLGSSRATKLIKNITFAVNCCHFYQSKDSKYFFVSLKAFIYLRFFDIEYTLYFTRTQLW